jgi:hypothetical protein
VVNSIIKQGSLYGPSSYRYLSVILLQELFCFTRRSIAARSATRAASVVFKVTKPAAMLQSVKWFITFFDTVKQKGLH